MKMIFAPGKNEIFKDSVSALDYIRSAERENIKINPDQLHINNDGKRLYLEVFNGKVRQFPMRESFMLKLLKWFSFPSHQLKILDIDTITSVMNDYLLAIKRLYINVKIEYGEALTITSDKYCEIEDSQIIKRLDPKTVDMIYLTDFESYFRTKTKLKIVPFPDDIFGVGINIVNSETGFKAFQINNFLLRYTCSNGAYVKDYEDDIKYYHYDLFAPSVYDMIEYKVQTIQERVEMLKIQLIGMETDLKRDEVQKLNQFLFHRTGVKLLVDILENDRMPTKYELFNIITHRAKDFALSKRILIEEVAGGMVNIA
jgi:hypothetical protein